MKAKRDGVVEISGRSYSLRYVKNLKRDDGAAAWGMHKPDTCEILIDADLSHEFSKVVLTHEIMHGILEMSGQSGNNDEGLCDAVAYGLESVKINGKRLLR